MSVYNLEMDLYIKVQYDVELLYEKSENKCVLQCYFGLLEKEDILIILMVMRLMK